MLKFSDLKVDFKSFENTLNSYMKLFPNSYMPLLVMSLSREGLLEIINDFKGDDSKVLLSVSRDDVLDMVRPNTPLPSNISSKEIYHKLFDLPVDSNDLINKGEYSILQIYPQIIELITKNVNTCSLVYHSNGNKTIDNIVSIVQSNSRQSTDKAALLIFCMIFMNKIPARSKDADLYDFKDAVECFEMTATRILSHTGILENWQPIELTKIILSQYPGGSVYNPFAGVASYHTVMSYGWKDEVGFQNTNKLEQANNSIGDSYYGEELNELIWAIGKMRLMFYQMDSSNYVLGDSTKGFNCKVDNIMTTPPFNMQVINEQGGKEYADHLALRRGMDVLSENGMMAIVVPMSFLNRKDTYDIRKELINKRYGLIIVYLPENVFSSTKISTAIIFVHKCNAYCQNMKFVDATKMISGRRGHSNILKVDAISNMIEHDEHPSDRYPLEDVKFKFGGYDSIQEISPLEFNTYVSIASIDDVIANDYNLSPSFYFSSFIDIPEGYKLVPLDNLVCHKMFPNASGVGVNIVVNPGDLAKDSHLPIIDRVNLSAGNFNPNYTILGIDEKALLISSIGDLKPSILGPVHSEVYISPNILAFSLDEKKVSPEYLVGELSKEYVKEQLRMKMIGSVIHRIQMHDALKLQILVPIGKNFLKKEVEIVQERKNKYLERMGVELSELKDRRHDEYVKLLRQRKHRLQQIMNEFAPAFAQLNKCRVKNGGALCDNDVVAARTGETVGSYFDKLNTIVSKVEDLITNLVDKEDWGELREIDIDKFVDNIPHIHPSDRYEIQVFHDRSYEIYEEGELADLNDPRLIKISEDSLSTLFENIIANACKWGFTDAIREDYIIRIVVSDGVIINQNAVCIGVYNNGTPIHESLDRSRFFEWGYGSGTGIGTSQLKDIVEHYGGSIKLNEFPDDSAGFFTEYEIVLPLIDND